MAGCPFKSALGPPCRLHLQQEAVQPYCGCDSLAIIAPQRICHSQETSWKALRSVFITSTQRAAVFTDGWREQHPSVRPSDSQLSWCYSPCSRHLRILQHSLSSINCSGGKKFLTPNGFMVQCTAWRIWIISLQVPNFSVQSPTLTHVLHVHSSIEFRTRRCPWQQIQSRTTRI